MSGSTEGGLSWRERVEFERRLVHAGGALFPVPYLLGWLTWPETGVLLAVGLLVAALLEFLRLVAGLDHVIYRKLTRPYEDDSVAGYALYMVSMAAVAVLFPPYVAIPAMLMLAIGDPVSGMLGRNGPREPKRPTVWAATFAVCVALAVPFTVPELGTTVGIAAALAGAAGATVADGLPALIRGTPVDDNLTIPPAAAAGVWIAVALLG